MKTKTTLDWAVITGDLDTNGYALVPDVLSARVCDQLVSGYSRTDIYRKTVVMERHRFGLGEYKYFEYPLPDVVAAIRDEFYPKLAPIANRWMEQLRIETRYPAMLGELMSICRQHGQTKPTPLILKYGKGGFNTLHQDLYGEVFFPLQLAIFLNEPDTDYAGGEFVLTQQVPRAQTKAIVLRPRKGDMVILTTNFRPVRSANGFYRANMKHGVSEITDGVRHTLGVIFHDATS